MCVFCFCVRMCVYIVYICRLCAYVVYKCYVYVYRCMCCMYACICVLYMCLRMYVFAYARWEHFNVLILSRYLDTELNLIVLLKQTPIGRCTLYRMSHQTVVLSFTAGRIHASNNILSRAWRGNLPFDLSLPHKYTSRNLCRVLNDLETGCVESVCS